MHLHKSNAHSMDKIHTYMRDYAQDKFIHNNLYRCFCFIVLKCFNGFYSYKFILQLAKYVFLHVTPYLVYLISKWENKLLELKQINCQWLKIKSCVFNYLNTDIWSLFSSQFIYFLTMNWMLKVRCLPSILYNGILNY